MTYVYASPEAVALAWVAQLPGFSTAMVGDTVPTDNSTWAASGFVTPVITGGSSNIYYRKGEPVVTLQTWACAPDTGIVPWGKARNLAEAIRAGTYLNQPVGLILPVGNENARVLSTYFLGEPRRTYGDFGDYATYSVDLQMHWVAIPK